MPDIKFYCPECNSKLGVDPSAAGFFVDCPDCGKRIRIPEESTVAPPRVEVPREVPTHAAGPDVTQRIEAIGPDQEAAAAPSLTERIKKLEKERAQFEQSLRLEQLRGENIDKLEEKIADLLQEIETARGREQKAREETAKIIAEKLGLEEQLTRTTAQHERTDDLEATVEAVRQEAQQLATSLSEAESRVARLTREKESLAAEETAARTALTAAEQAAEELRTRNQKLQSTIEDVRRETTNIQSKVDRAEADALRLAELSERVEAVEQEKAALQASLRELESAPVTEMRDEDRAALEKLQAEVDALREDKKATDETIRKLERDNAQLRERPSRQTGRITEAAPVPAAPPRAAPPAAKAVTTGPAPAPANKPRPRPTQRRTGPIRPPVRGSGTSLYQKTRAAGAPRVVLNRRLVLAAIVLILVVAALWLSRLLLPGLSGGFPGFASMFSKDTAPPGEMLPEASTSSAVRKDALGLREPAILDDVRITAQDAIIKKVARVNTLGNEVESEQPYLVIEVVLENTSTSESIYMMDAWEQSTLRDDLNNVLRPAFRNQYALDSIAGTLGASEIRAGESLHDRLVFEVPAEEAGRFTLISNPGFWRKTTGGGYTALSDARFVLTFTREQITQEP